MHRRVTLALLAVSAAGVGAWGARAAARGAALNVRITARTLRDKELASSLVKRAQGLERDAESREAAILAAVEQRL